MSRTLLLLFFLGWRLVAGAADLLEPEQAFRFSARALPGAVEVRFAIAEGYYLYRDRMRFSAEGPVKLGAPQFPEAIPHSDQFFGETPIYRKQVTIRVPAEGSGRFDLKVISQGCADVGVCYVPMESRTGLTLTAAAGSGPLEPTAQPSGISLYASDIDIARLFGGSFLLLVGGFLVLGVLLAFTPCMLPMIPILSGIIAGEGSRLNKSRALVLSLVYVLSMALTYAVAGVAAAYAGSLLATYLQNVWVLGAFAALFVLLALSMFGVYELKLPGFLEQKLYGSQERLRGGRLASVAAMGVFSAVLVSPCVSAPLAGTLLQISRTGDVVLGGTALFALATGMGLPLIAVGVSEGALLPKAGAWMASVRRFFGLLLLGVALWILSPMLPAQVEMLAWAVLLAGGALYLGTLRRLPAGASPWAWVWKGLGVVAIALGVAALVAAFRGGEPAHPVPWQRIASVAELDERLRTAGKPAMLDFYADWCVSCKEMEKLTFSDPRVRAEMERLALLQADVTEANAADRALLKRFSLFGPPGIIFFDAQGREIPGLRVIGFQPAERFLETLGAVARH